MGKGGMRGEGGCMANGACVVKGGVCHAPPPRHREIQSVNARPVRILLECILVNSSSCRVFCNSAGNNNV